MAKDGWICSECRDIQCDVSDQSDLNCLGEGCSNPLARNSGRRRICLWCGMPVCGQTIANRWGSYGQRQTVTGSCSIRPPSPRDEDVVLETADGDEMPPEGVEPRDPQLRAILNVEDG